MQKILPLIFALSISAGPVLAWGSDKENNCPFSKDTSNQESKTEQVEESEK